MTDVGVGLGPRAPRGCHPESGLPLGPGGSQTAQVTDTSTRPAAAATRWDRHSPLQTSAELLLGLSFAATVAFGGYAAVTGRMTVLSQGAGVVFLVTLTCVLVSWFRAVERSESTAVGRRAAAATLPSGAISPSGATGSTTAIGATTAPEALEAIDAEYRR